MLKNRVYAMKLAILGQLREGTTESATSIHIEQYVTICISVVWHCHVWALMEDILNISNNKNLMIFLYYHFCFLLQFPAINVV